MAKASEVAITSVDGSLGAETGSPGSVAIPIVDDDGPITVTVSHTPDQLNEADTGNEVTVTFTASRAPTADITVAFSVSGTGDAVEGSDYSVPGSSPVSYCRRNTEASITIAVMDDTDDDDGEGIEVTIDSVNGNNDPNGQPR